MNRGAVPNLIIIGSMKCGTSSLHRYLSVHPDIQMSFPKELNFFMGKNWRKRELDWYLDFFQGQFQVRGEASPNYTKFPFIGGVPQRIHQVSPQARLIYMVRDPVDRAVSHYVHNISKGRETRPIEKAITAKGHYISVSRYAFQLEQYLHYFSMDQIKVISLKELSVDPGKVVSEVLGFLGVDVSLSHRIFSQVFHTTEEKKRPVIVARRLAQFSPFGKPVGIRIRRRFSRLLERPIERPVVSAQLRERMTEILAPDTERLRELTGLSLNQWSV